MSHVIVYLFTFKVNFRKKKKIYVLQVEKISEFLVIGFLKIYFLMRVGEAWLLETYTLILQYQK